MKLTESWFDRNYYRVLEQKTWASLRLEWEKCSFGLSIQQKEQLEQYLEAQSEACFEIAWNCFCYGYQQGKQSNIDTNRKK